MAEYKFREQTRGPGMGGRGQGPKRNGKPVGRKFTPHRNIARFQLSKDFNFDYKNFSMLQKFLTDRGKIVPRRISAVSAKNQRKLITAIKRARFLALLSAGGINRGGQINR